MASCENLSTCAFFREFKANSETVVRAWIRLYCEDMERSETCARKQAKRATGVAPPVNLSPTGKLL